MFALLDSDDSHHAACRDFLETYPSELIVPTLVISEVAHFTMTRLGVNAELRFLGDLAAGLFAVQNVTEGDWLRIAELVSQYRDLRLGTVDASVVAAAERLGITDIATLDHRDFGAVRPRHVRAFTLLP